MSETFRVCIYGHIGAGKTTIAGFLSNALTTKGVDNIVLPLAASARAKLAIAISHVEPEIDPKKFIQQTISNDLDENNIRIKEKTRSLVSSFAEYLKTIDPEYWLKDWEEYVNSVSPTIAIVDDLRFPVEHSWFSREKTFFVKITDPTNLEDTIWDTDFEGFENDFEISHNSDLDSVRKIVEQELLPKILEKFNIRKL